MGKTTNETRPVFVAARIRRAFVLSKRIAGYKYREIAEMAVEHFGVEKLPKHWDAIYAYRDVKRELDRQGRQTYLDARKLVRMECDRLDEMLRAIWPEVLDGNLQAIEKALKISERRSKLVGLNAPDKIAPTTPDGDMPYDGMVLRVFEHVDDPDLVVTEDGEYDDEDDDIGSL